MQKNKVFGTSAVILRLYIKKWIFFTLHCLWLFLSHRTYILLLTNSYRHHTSAFTLLAPLVLFYFVQQWIYSLKYCSRLRVVLLHYEQAEVEKSKQNDATFTYSKRRKKWECFFRVLYNTSSVESYRNKNKN